MMFAVELTIGVVWEPLWICLNIRFGVDRGVHGEQQTNALRTDATREHRLGTLKPCSD